MAVLVTISLVGLLVMTLAAGRWPHSRRDDGGRPGRGRPKLVPIRSTGGPNAELFRILDDPRFGDLRLSRRAHQHALRACPPRERVRGLQTDGPGGGAAPRRKSSSTTTD